MGWPKKNEVARLYYERAAKTYLMVFQGEEYRNPKGEQEAVGELLIHNDPENPKLCSCSVSPVYLYKKCKRVSFSDMPYIWQKEMLKWIDVDNLKEIRGIWRMNELEPITKEK